LKRKFVTNLALLLFLNLLVKPIYAFGIDVGVQNAVGAVEYGNYFILLNFSLIFQIFLDLGIESFSRVEIARHSHLLNKYFSYILPLKFTLGLFYFIFCSAIGHFMGWKGHEFSLLFVLLFNQFLASLILYFRANLGGMHMFNADSIVSVIDRFVVVVICGFLLLDPVTHKAFKIEWLVYAQTAAYLISASLAFSMVFAKAEFVKFNFDWKYYGSLLKRSLPFALLFLLMAVYLRIDSVLIGKIMVNGKEQAGIYAQGFRIIEILSNYGYLFTLILLPVFSRMIKLGESVEHLIRLSSALLLVPAVIIAFGCYHYRNDIMNILYIRHVDSATSVFSILTFSFLGICITYIYGTLLTANGSLRQLNIMAIIAVVINITLNLILIKRFGITGAAIANASTQLFTALYQFVMVKRIFHLKSDYLFLLRVLVFLMIISISAFLFSKMQIFWMYSFLIYIFSALMLSFMLGLLKVKAFYDILYTGTNE